jgi:signal transduction histidine kinase/ligand-binding sensor domain-containing protein
LVAPAENVRYKDEQGSPVRAVPGQVYTKRFASRVISRHVVCVLLLFLLLGSIPAASGEQLPVRRYAIEDGLPSNTATCVRRDSRGFLWFCTTEGLSRFDGYSFTNYGVEQGLPDPSVTDLMETRDGMYWVGTRRGLALFDPRPGPKKSLFTPYLPADTETARHVNSLYRDRDGFVWVATEQGAYRILDYPAGWRFEHVELPETMSANVEYFAQDGDGYVWMNTGDYASAMLCWRAPEGRTGCLPKTLFEKTRIVGLFVDRENRIWVGTYKGIMLLAPNARQARNPVWRVFHKKDGLLNEVSGGFFQSADGRLWVSAGAMFEIIGSGKEVSFKLYSREFGAPWEQDIEGNLWIGTARLASHGFVNYGLSDGLNTEDIRSLFEGSDGSLYAVTGVHSRVINRFDGKRFMAVAPYVPGHDSKWDWATWGWGQLHFQDHLGEWWVGTGVGLLRYPRVRFEDLATTPPRAIYGAEKAAEKLSVFRLFEDSRGDIWISSWAAPAMRRWNRVTEKFQSFGAKEGWSDKVPTAYREDHSGNVWMGLYDHDLCRFRRGHFDCLRHADGFPDGTSLSIWVDHAGRLWAATTKSGLVRIDQPDADRLTFRTYTTKEGLSSNDVRAITEDRWGRIYLWTGRGVDRLKPETGEVVHYTAADGLVQTVSDNNVAFTDRHGSLWFGLNGLSRFEPVAETDLPGNLSVYLQKIRINGVPLPISELGEQQLSSVVLQPSQNSMQVEFGSLRFGLAGTLRYQYRLEPSDENWSASTELRTVNYAVLRPGRYRFLVRAVNERGDVSPSPAQFRFRILAPVWQRAWFLTVAGVFAALLTYAFYRYRLNRALELERIRTRIASDLHDDVGSGLTQIAILSEVIRQDRSGGSKSEHLARIGDLSRELVDGMGEIVWSLNPQHDQVSDLVQRMRRFASDTLLAKGIGFEFDAPREALDLPLRSDFRRQMYLIFKEAINNALKHSGCTEARAQFSIEKGVAILKITDNGCGLAAEKNGGNGTAGHGLSSMRARAKELGGTLEISSKPGEGTEILLRVPLGRSVLKGLLKTT